MSDTITDLRRLAEQATPGPWAVDRSAHMLVVDDTRGPIAEVEDSWTNTAYIAAANPQAIIQLLDERDAIEAARLRNAHGLLNAERRVAELEEGLDEIRTLYTDNRTRPATFAIRAGEIAVALLDDRESDRAAIKSYARATIELRSRVAALEEGLRAFIDTAYPNNGEGSAAGLIWHVPERAFGPLRALLDKEAGS